MTVEDLLWCVYYLVVNEQIQRIVCYLCVYTKQHVDKYDVIVYL